jgi:hypothetical protein
MPDPESQKKRALTMAELIRQRDELREMLKRSEEAIKHAEALIAEKDGSVEEIDDTRFHSRARPPERPTP